MSTLIGQTVHHYQMESILGEGGMGTVYQAYDTVSSRLVAIKVMHDNLVNDDDLLQQFTNEINSLKRLDHKHLVTFYDSGLISGTPYFVTELVDGIDVRGYLRQLQAHSQLMDMRDVVVLGRQLAEALAECHRHQVVHRDIKPENILLRRSATNQIDVVIIDFGLAQLLDDVQTGSKRPFQGSAPYMSPEMIGGQTQDSRSDLYALGVVLYELLTGRQPFLGKTTTEILKQHQAVAPVKPSSIQVNIPPDLESLVLRLLAKTPEGRCQTGEEVYTLLDQVLPSAKSAAPQHGGYHSTSTVEVTTQLEMPEFVSQIKIPERIDLNETWYGGEFRLLVGHERERPFTYSLHKPVLTIGRSPDNDIVLNDYHVSRHHARLERITVEQDQGRYTARWQLQDIGSINGVYDSIGERLSSEEIHVWEPNKPWRIGPYFLQWERLYEQADVVQPTPVPIVTNGGSLGNSQTETVRNGNGRSASGLAGQGRGRAAAVAVGAAGGAAALRAQSGTVPSAGNNTVTSELGFTAHLVPPVARLARDEQQQIEVVMRNNSNTADHLEIMLEGHPQGVMYEGRDSRILPGQEKHLMLNLTLVDQYAAGGEHLAMVSLWSRPRNRVVATLPLTIDIAAVRGFQMELQPPNISGSWSWRNPGATTSLQLFNSGNETQKYELRFSDPNNAVRFERTDKWVTVPAKTYNSVPITVTPARRPWFGMGRDTYDFRVQAAPDGDLSEEKETQGQYSVPPRIPILVIPLVLLLCIGAAALTFWLNGVVATAQAQAADASNARATIVADREEAIAGNEATIAALRDEGNPENLATISALETVNANLADSSNINSVLTAEAVTAVASNNDQSNDGNDASDGGGGSETGNESPAGGGGSTDDGGSSEEAEETPEPSSTPVPTSTPVLTNTPAPTETPVPTSTPVPAPVFLSANAAQSSVSEGAAAASIEISLTGPATSRIQLSYATRSGTAITGLDFQEVSNIITWEIGENSSKSITVPLTDDEVAEANEQFSVTLTIISGASFSGGFSSQTITFTITDDDGALQIVGNPGTSVNEGDQGTTTQISIEIVPSEANDEVLTATCSVEGVSATVGSDFQEVVDELLTWPARSEDSRFCVVTVIGDDIYEGTGETLRIEIEDNVNNVSVLEDNLFTIVEDDDPPEIEFISENSQIQEGDGFVTVQLNMSGQSQEDVTVGISTSGTAEEGLTGDYTLNRQQVTWDAGDSGIETITINIEDDDFFEGDETIEVSLTNPNSATLGDRSTVEYLILDNDEAEAVLSPENLTFTEGDADANYTLSLASVPETPVSFAIIASGPCLISTNNVDFSKTTSLTIGNTTPRTIHVRDANVSDLTELTQECTITHTATDDYFEAGTVTLISLMTILDKDPTTLDVTGELTTSPVTINEDEGTLDGALRLTNPITPEISITVAMTITASENGVCEFASGNPTSKTHTFTSLNDTDDFDISIDITDNDIDGANVTCSLSFGVTDSGEYTISPPSTIEIAVEDDDTVGLTNINIDQALTEDAAGQTGTIQFSLNSQPTAEVTATFTAGDPDNCTLNGAVNGVLAVSIDTSDWEVVQSITVQAIDDFVDEDEAHACAVTVQFTGGDYVGRTELDADLSTITITDNDTAGFNPPNPPFNFFRSENFPFSETYVLSLDTQPSSVVEITFTAQTFGGIDETASCWIDVGDGNGFGAVRILEIPSNPTQAPQLHEFDILIRDDDVDEPDPHDCAITVSIQSADEDYNQAAFATQVQDVLAQINNIADNDTPNINLVTLDPVVNEGGTAAGSFTLNTQPQGTVAISLTTATDDCTVDPPQVNFTTTDFGNTIPFTINGRTDNDLDEDTAFCAVSLIAAADNPTDPTYNNLTNFGLLTVIDNDLPNITITDIGGITPVTETQAIEVSFFEGDVGDTPYDISFEAQAAAGVPVTNTVSVTASTPGGACSNGLDEAIINVDFRLDQPNLIVNGTLPTTITGLFTIIGDDEMTDDVDECFIIDLTINNPSLVGENYEFDHDQFTKRIEVIITDDDAPPQITVTLDTTGFSDAGATPPEIIEGNFFPINFTLNGQPINQPDPNILVEFTVVDNGGMNVSDDDYALCLNEPVGAFPGGGGCTEGGFNAPQSLQGTIWVFLKDEGGDEDLFNMTMTVTSTPAAIVTTAPGNATIDNDFTDNVTNIIVIKVEN